MSSTGRPALAGTAPWGRSQSAAPILRSTAEDPLSTTVEIRRVTYRCAAGHTINLPFDSQAQAPARWDCRRCDLPAELADAAGAEVGGEASLTGRTAPPGKTHFERVLERRTRAELEVLLDERLALLRAGRVGRS